MGAPEDGHLQPDTSLPPHTPGAGAARLRLTWGPDRVPESSPEVKRQVDDLVARAQQSITERRGRAAA